MLSELRQQTSQAYLRGDLTEAERLKTAGDAVRDAVEKLKKTATTLEEATKK